MAQSKRKTQAEKVAEKSKKDKMKPSAQKQTKGNKEGKKAVSKQETAKPRFSRFFFVFVKSITLPHFIWQIRRQPQGIAP